MERPNCVLPHDFNVFDPNGCQRSATGPTLALFAMAQLKLILGQKGRKRHSAAQAPSVSSILWFCHLGLSL